MENVGFDVQAVEDRVNEILGEDEVEVSLEEDGDNLLVNGRPAKTLWDQSTIKDADKAPEEVFAGDLVELVGKELVKTILVNRRGKDPEEVDFLEVFE